MKTTTIKQALPRFAITRTVTNNGKKPFRQRGISADIELFAVDATDAERQAQNLFAHERGAVATYIVKRCR